MSSKKSQEFSDESRESFIDTEEVSGRDSCPSSLNSDTCGAGESSATVSSREDEGESSEPEVSTLSRDNCSKKRCSHEIDKSEKYLKTPRLVNAESSPPPPLSNKEKKVKVNYDSVSSLSVSSSPDGTRSELCVPNSSHRLNSLYPRHDQGNHDAEECDRSPIIINHAEILSKMEQELRDKGFQMDLNSNHHLFTDYNKLMYKSANYSSDSTRDKTLSQVPSKAKLSFGIDRILSLSDENSNLEVNRRTLTTKEFHEESRSPTPAISNGPSSACYQIPKTSPNSDSPLRHNNLNLSLHLHQSQHHRHPHSHQNYSSTSPLPLNRCTECYFLGRFCRNNGNLPYTSHTMLVNSSPGTVNGGGAATGGVSNVNLGISAPFSHHHPWMTASMYENSPLLSPSAYHPPSGLPSTYGLNASNFSTMSSLVGCSSVSGGGRRKRSWSRAVFSSLQRKGLEKRFQIQKYITKPDRRQLAATLGLTDAQVKVWFQNRRMKWRHSKEGKVTSGIGDGISPSPSSTSGISMVSTSDNKK